MIFPEVLWQDVGRSGEGEAGVQSPTRQTRIYMGPMMSRKCILFSEVLTQV